MVTKRKSSKKDSANELQDLAKVLTGEMELRLKEDEMKKIKERAAQRQKDIKRERIVSGEKKMEAEDEDRKVVQNINLFEWDAPIRLKMPFDPRSYLIAVGLCLLFIVFLAVLGHYWLMASIIALLFFVYVAGTTDPIMVKHTITSRGIDTLDHLYEWFLLDSFYFTKKDNQYLLVVGTKLRVPSQLLLLIDKKDLQAIFVILQDKLLYKDLKKQGRVDKMSLGEYIPLEKI